MKYKNYQIRRYDDKNLVLECFKDKRVFEKVDGALVDTGQPIKKWVILGYYATMENALRELRSRICEKGKDLKELRDIIVELKKSLIQ